MHDVEAVGATPRYSALDGLRPPVVMVTGGWGSPPSRPTSTLADSARRRLRLLFVDRSRVAVFAVGDVTQIKLANDLSLPKAAIIAEREGTRVAEAIAAEIAGADAPAPFDGHGHCFLELCPSPL